MNTRFLSLIAFAAATAALVGCNVGNVPSGMDEGDAKAAIARMTPEQRIKAIASSPMPGPEKDRLFKEIEAETGVKASDVLAGQPQAPGAGAAKL